MPTAKDLLVKPISSQDARRIVRKLHYSGKVVQNSALHLGVFLNDKCCGALQFGPPMDKRNMLGIVRGSRWDSFVELNRMALADHLPRNSESRVLAVSMRLLRKHAPQLKWVVSFADAAQCGDGTIYRAAGFVLTGIKKTHDMIRLPSGAVIHHLTLKSSPLQPRPELGGRTYYDVTSGGCNLHAYVEAANGELLEGYQLRYIYFLDPAWRAFLSVREIPYSEIPAEVRMYKGQKGLTAGEQAHECAQLNCACSSLAERAASSGEAGGSIPTHALEGVS